MNEWIIGIDPGKSGSMALLRGSERPDWVKLDETEATIAEELATWVCMAETAGVELFALIEKVGPMRKEGRRQGVSSAFTFGQSYGFMRGCVAGRIAFDEVAPTKWQSAMGCRTKGDKNVTKAKAQQLFPGVKITHAIADALLIAEYGRRLRAGTL